MLYGGDFKMSRRKTVNNSILDKAYQGYMFSGKKEIGKQVVYHFENETGMGEMLCFNLLDGIQLTYNHLNMETSYQDIV